MASNLPLCLSNRQVNELRAAFNATVDRFASLHGLDRDRVALEAGFVAANYAARVGVLDAKYQEWIDAHRAQNDDQVTAAEPAAAGDAARGHGSGDGLNGRAKGGGGRGG